MLNSAIRPLRRWGPSANGITACCQSPRCGCSSEAAGTANSAVCSLESLHSTDTDTFVAKPLCAGRPASQRPSKSALLSLCRILLEQCFNKLRCIFKPETLLLSSETQLFYVDPKESSLL